MEIVFGNGPQAKHLWWYNTVDFTISDTIPLEEITPPKISNLSLENKAYNTSSIPFSFNVDKPMSLVEYSLDNQMKQTIVYFYHSNASTRHFNTTLEKLSDGSHNLIVYATDTFGNIGVSDTINFTVDTIPPAIAMLAIQNETCTSNTWELNFTVNEATSWKAYSLDNQPNVTITGNATITGLQNGVHNVTVYANDTAGNTATSETIYFIVEVPASFPITLVVVSSVSAAIASFGVLLYFRKTRKKV